MNEDKGTIMGSTTRRAALAVLALAASAACDRPPSTEEEKTLHAMGAMLFGPRLKALDLSDEELGFLFQGARDSIAGEADVQEAIAEYAPKVRDFARTRGERVIAATKEEGDRYRASFKGERGDGARTTESGLIYVVAAEGEGDKPGAEDTVRVKYRGQLPDGTVFDENQEGVDLPLNRVIKGWSEGLQMMAPGGRMTLVIPPDIGYGDFGAPPRIPGGSTLIFDVELLEVKKAGSEGSPPAGG